MVNHGGHCRMEDLESIMNNVRAQNAPARHRRSFSGEGHVAMRYEANRSNVY